MKKISSKFLVVLLLVAGMPLIISSLINIDSMRRSLIIESQTTLNAIADYKLHQIEQYLDHQGELVRLVAKSPQVTRAFERLSGALARGVDSRAYLEIDGALRDQLEYFGDSTRFADIYLIADNGDVLFSLKHKADFGSNLIEGPYADSPLADSFNLALAMYGTNFTGYQPYAPSNGAYSAFFSIPIFSLGRPLGTVSVQMTSEALYAFSRDYTGLYQTGEVMLGKIDIDSVLLVAPLRHDTDAAYGRRVPFDPDSPSPLELAARGNAGSGEHVDYRGIESISAWRYLPQLQWGMVLKLDRAEVLAAGRHLVEKVIVEVLISLVAVILIALLLSHWLSRPITRLLAATRKIAEGELDHRVAYRSADEIGELADSFNAMTEKLRISLERAEAAAITKTQFLMTMSHEIRTPLNGVLGMAQLLEETDLTAEQHDYLKTIVGSGNNLLTIINDILDFSKLDTVTVELESIPFNLEQLGQECLELILPAANDKQLELVLDYQPDAPAYFHGDPARLRQVLLNFLGNAVKFTERGFIRLAIGCQVEGEMAGLRIDVEDSGIGIEAGKQDYLFEEFFQVDQATNRRYGGTGLGLAITRKLVGLMDGSIEVKSTQGEGSRFRVQLRLPLAKTPQPATKTGLAGTRTLLIGDGDRNVQVLHRMMLHFGMTTDRIGSDADIVEHLAEASQNGTPYRLALFSNRLDPQTNIALAEKIRAQDALGEVRLMVHLPGGQRGDANRFHRVGVDAYLSKLGSRDELHSMLESVLAKRPQDPMITHYSVREAPRAEEESGQLSGRILLVEDAPTNQLIASKILTQLGLEVDIATDGQQAVDAVAANRYDLIFMDCQMPVMDGFEATRIIRSRELPDRRTSIIALTANASDEDVKRCEACGMDGVVTKPFRKGDLVACITRSFAPLRSRAS